MSGEAKEGPVDLQVVVQFDADADPFNSRPTMEERGMSDNQPSSDSSASSVLDVTENRGRVYTGDGYEKTFLCVTFHRANGSRAFFWALGIQPLRV
jgi:hypothetical protein